MMSIMHNLVVLSLFCVIFGVSSSLVAGQTVNATCLSGSEPFIIAETCPPGFYCPFLPSPPTFCSPTQECSLDRLANKFCEPQGMNKNTIK